MPNRTPSGVHALLLLVSSFSLVSSRGAEPPTVLAGEGSGSEYIFKTWETDDGLPDNSVTCINQTRDGYLWFGTFKGLARFDGKRFTVFDSDSTPGLLSNSILGMYPDRAGRLWITHGKGKMSLLEHGKFRGIPVPNLPGKARNDIWCLEEDEQNQLWVGTDQGLCRWREERLAMTPPPLDFPAGPVRGLRADRAGRLWFFVAAQMGRVIGDRFVPAENCAVLQGMRVLGIAPSPSGGFWIVGERQGAKVYCRLLPEGRITEPQRLAHQYWIWSAMADRFDNLWLGSDGGLLCLQTNGSFLRFTSKQGLSHNVVRAVFEDHEGSIWAGTEGGGLVQLRPRPFQMFRAAEGLRNEIVYAVTPARTGGLWIATHGAGIFRLLDGNITSFADQPAFARALHEDRNGTLWAGSLLADGVYRFDGPARRGLGVMMEARAICKDRVGNLWIGGNGLARGRDGTFLRLTNDWPASRQVQALAEDASGTLWIGTVGEGLFAWKDGKFRHYGKTDGLPHATVNSLLAARDGELWMGTDGGLARLKDDRFSRFTAAEGLPVQSVRSLAEDNLGNLWMTSLHGIVRVRHQALQDFAEGRQRPIDWFHYDREDGLATGAGTGSAQPQIAQTPDGKLWFATLKGVAMVDPARLTVNTNPPPVVIEDVLADGVDALKRETVEALKHPGAAGSLLNPSTLQRFNKLRLPAGTRRLEVRYTALSFVSPDKVRFQYRLEGLNRDWVNGENRRAAVFDYVPPGDYRFRVIAANKDGVWNEAGAELGFTVLPFFWQTWWFRGSALLVLVAALAWAVHDLSARRLKRRLALVEQQHAVETERSRISQDMHDDLGARLTKIAFYGELAAQSAQQQKTEVEHVGSVVQMCREAVESLDEMVWSVSPENDSLRDLADYLCQYASAYFEQTPIRVRFDLPPAVPAHRLDAGTRHQLLLVFKEALNNIVKHAAAQEVLLQVRVEAAMFALIVADDGRGLPASGSASILEGNGLTNMRQRVDGIGGTLEIKPRPGGGTEVRMLIPLSGKRLPTKHTKHTKDC